MLELSKVFLRNKPTKLLVINSVSQEGDVGCGPSACVHLRNETKTTLVGARDYQVGAIFDRLQRLHPDLLLDQ